MIDFNFYKVDEDGKPKWKMDKETMLEINDMYESIVQPQTELWSDRDILLGLVKPKDFIKKWREFHPVVKDSELMEEMANTYNVICVVDFKELNDEWEMYKFHKKARKKLGV